MSYHARDFILRRMGFSSYKEYLASDKWKTIRSRVTGDSCKYCGGKRDATHHTIYDKRVMSGSSLKGLRPVCKDCHEFIEFDVHRNKRKSSDARYLTLAMDAVVKAYGPQQKWCAIEDALIDVASQIRAEVASGRSFKFAVSKAASSWV